MPAPDTFGRTRAWHGLVRAHQPAQHGVGVLCVAQVPCAVEGVQARYGEAERVADVVQPRGGFQEICISVEYRCQTAGLSGHAFNPDLSQG